MDKLEKAFARCLAKFDFEAAYAAMDKHKWKWYCTDDTPTVDMLIQNCVDLWCKCGRNDGDNIGSGGFIVGIDEGHVYITFELTKMEYAE